MRALDPIIVAPDCPTGALTDPIAERAVMALLASVLDDYLVDRRRILMTGFSLGGRGVLFMASRHADLFAQPVPVAALNGDEPIDRLGTIPTDINHSREDAAVLFRAG
jgi:predicted peptidase